MEPSFVVQPAFEVVGLELVTAPKSPQIPALWDSFVPRIPEISNPAPENAAYGVMRRSEGDTREFRYLAGLSVAGSSPPPSGMKSILVPGGRYAVFRSSLAELSRAFDWIYGSWLPGSGLKAEPRPVYERYGEDFEGGDPHSPVTLHIPVSAMGNIP